MIGTRTKSPAPKKLSDRLTRLEEVAGCNNEKQALIDEIMTMQKDPKAGPIFLKILRRLPGISQK